MNPGEIWHGYFPLEEDETQFLPRPIIILGFINDEVLSVKVTKHERREDDDFDTPILNWRYSKLGMPSTARISKTILIPKKQFKYKIGDLHRVDLIIIKDTYIEFINNKD